MKGPHFFEKRKKEMARQQKAKEKADRKAQRKAGGGKDDADEFLDADGLGAAEGETDGQTGDQPEGEAGVGQAGLQGGAVNGTAPAVEQVKPEHAPPAVGGFRGTPGG
ncbi:MAG: hypothetical protein H7X95_12915 [Deltaproteobacteria bacterium]|nr:hypothetical protein [Deltaproteobacteria bacterium]